METGRLAELGMLSAELVHELRQPLFAVKALAQIMSREAAPQQGDRIQAMLGQLAHLEGVLDRHALTGRKPAKERSVFDLQAAVDDGVGLLRHRALTAGKQLDLSMLPATEAALGDPAAARQITANLVGNALDAARSQVNVRVSGLVLEVEDDGAGIPDDMRDRVFEPFFSTKQPGEGTGLGLPIIAHLVRAAGGTIEIASSPSGTLFTVRFAAAGAIAATGSGAAGAGAG
jgi:signal transduction histidine kinase